MFHRALSSALNTSAIVVGIPKFRHPIVPHFPLIRLTFRPMRRCLSIRIKFWVSVSTLIVPYFLLNRSIFIL
jgi:hypothetical protein